MSTSTLQRADTERNAVLRLPEFRYLLMARLCSAWGGMGFAIVIGYQLYQLTKDPLALGWLGLVEAIPALSLSLLGGHIADRSDRRRLVLIAATAEAICIVLLAWISFDTQYRLWTVHQLLPLIDGALL